MSPVRIRYEPWLSSQVSCSQTDIPQPAGIMMEQTEPTRRTWGGNRGKKRVGGETTGFVLKVKLGRDGTKYDKKPKERMAEPAANTTVSRGGGGRRNVVNKG